MTNALITKATEIHRELVNQSRKTGVYLGPDAWDTALSRAAEAMGAEDELAEALADRGDCERKQEIEEELIS